MKPQRSAFGTPLALAACILVPALVYLTALHTPFIFDDYLSIVDNPDVKQLSNLKTRLIYQDTDYLYKNHPTRPLTFLTFTLNYHFGRMNTFGYHLVDLAIHILVTLSMFILTRKLFDLVFNRDDPLVPLAVALLFSVHPINVDVVAHINNRSDSMATLFYLVALFFFIRALDKRATNAGGPVNLFFYVGSLLSFVLSFASKQIAATLPIMLLLFDVMFLGRGQKKGILKNAHVHLPYWILLIAIMMFMSLYFGELGHMGSTWSRGVYALTQPYVILQYLKLVFVPVGQAIDHFVDPVNSLSETRGFLSTGAVTLILIAIYWLARRVPGKRELVLYAWLWFFVTLLPSSSIFPVNEPMAEKRVYLAGWGFALGIVLLYSLLFKVALSKNADSSNRKVFGGCILVHILVLSFLTFNRIQTYQKPDLLWEEVIAKYPNNPRPYNALGLHHYGQKNYPEAIKYYEKAVRLNPNYVEAYSNLGNIYYAQGDYGKALTYQGRAVEISPNYHVGHNNLGTVYYQIGSYDQAIRHFQKAIEINRNFVDPYNSLGAIYYLKKDVEKAAGYFGKALELNPRLAEAHSNLGLIHYEGKNYPKAIEYYLQAISLNPRLVNAHFGLALAYEKAGDYPKALAELEITSRLWPDNKLFPQKIESLKKLIAH
jgi:tetratricopeptide (TPR) repeat protein